MSKKADSEWFKKPGLHQIHANLFRMQIHLVLLLTGVVYHSILERWKHRCLPAAILNVNRKTLVAKGFFQLAQNSWVPFFSFLYIPKKRVTHKTSDESSLLIERRAVVNVF